MKRKGKRLVLFLIDLAVASAGTGLTFILKDDLTLPVAVAVILSFVTLLLMIERFMTIEVGMNQLKEEIEESNCIAFNRVHSAINVVDYFKKSYDLLYVSRFDQKIMAALLGKVSGDRLIISENQFYELVNDILIQLALDRASQTKKKPITDIEVMAVSFNDDEWKTTPDEDEFTTRSLELVKAGIRFRRLFILDKDEIQNMLNNKEFEGVITTHCRYNNGNNPFIEAKIIRDDDENILNAMKIHIKRFGSGFFCIKIENVYFLIYDITGDGSRGHVFIDQDKSKEIIDDFNHIWENGLDFTDEIHTLYDTQAHAICADGCIARTKCSHLKGKN